MQQFNRKNFAQQILSARTAVSLTRADLAKIAGMGHPLLKLAEDADPSVREEDLVKIVRAIESLDFEFLNGTFSPELLKHERSSGPATVTADPSMPGWVRRIYPRVLGLKDLVDDLEICGVMIDKVNLFISTCQQMEGSWPQQLVLGMKQARKFDIRVYWRNGVVNEAGLRYAVGRIEDVDPNFAEQLLTNISPTPPA